MEVTEERIADLEQRIAKQEHLHRYHDENGNVNHEINMNLIPIMLISAVMGSIVTILIVKTTKL